MKKTNFLAIFILLLAGASTHPVFGMQHQNPPADLPVQSSESVEISSDGNQVALRDKTFPWKIAVGATGLTVILELIRRIYNASKLLVKIDKNGLTYNKQKMSWNEIASITKEASLKNNKSCLIKMKNGENNIIDLSSFDGSLDDFLKITNHYLQEFRAHANNQPFNQNFPQPFSREWGDGIVFEKNIISKQRTGVSFYKPRSENPSFLAFIAGVASIYTWYLWFVGGRKHIVFENGKMKDARPLRWNSLDLKDFTGKYHTYTETWMTTHSGGARSTEVYTYLELTKKNGRTVTFDITDLPEHAPLLNLLEYYYKRNNPQ